MEDGNDRKAKKEKGLEYGKLKKLEKTGGGKK